MMLIYQHNIPCRRLLLMLLLFFGIGIMTAHGQDDDDDKPKVDFNKELEKTTNLIVMIRADFDGVPAFGAGIVFGRASDRLLIATARHVLRRGGTKAHVIHVTFRAAPETPVEATLLPLSDSIALDLAFLSVPRTAALPINPCTLSFNRLGWIADLERGDDVYPVGNPHGAAWAVPVAPDKVSQVVGKEIVFQSAFISIGHSGGGLLNGEARLVGMTTADEPPFGRAIDLQIVLQIARHWRLPVQLDTALHGGWTPLHVAASGGDPDAVRRALQDCGDANAKDDHEAIPLHMAAARGNLEVLALLVKAGANVDARDADGDPPAEWAIEKGNLKAVQWLVKAGAKINEKNNNGRTLMDIAAEHKQPPIVNFLINAGAQVNTASKGDDEGPLKQAVNNEDIPMIRQLLAAGAKADLDLFYYPIRDRKYEIIKLLLPAVKDINAEMPVEESTLIHTAVENRDLKLVGMLLDAGANINNLGRTKRTPLFSAFFETEDSAMQRLLLSRGAGIKGTDSTSMKTFMADAVASGNITAVRLMLDEKISPDEQGLRDLVYSNLEMAIREKNVEMVRILVQRGADLTGKGHGTTPMENARSAGNPMIVKILADAGLEVTWDDIRDAIISGDLPALKELANIKSLKMTREEMMMIAIDKNKPEIVQYLLQLGANPKVGWKDAISSGEIDIVRQLIKAGMNVNKILDNGETPLYVAADNRQTELVAFLLQQGAKPNAPGKEFETPFRDAVGKGEIPIARLLLQAGVPVNDTTGKQDIPLIVALDWRQWEMARFLIDNHADVNGKDAWKATPLHFAVKDDVVDTSTIRMLLEHKADPRAKNSDGETPLHLLVHENPKNVLAAIQLLLAAGADPNARNKDGETPLKLAQDSNLQLIVDFLKQHGAK